MLLVGIYKRSTTPRWTSPKPQQRGLARLGALLARVARCGVAGDCLVESHPPDRNRTSHLPSLAVRALRALTASSKGPKVPLAAGA